MNVKPFHVFEIMFIPVVEFSYYDGTEMILWMVYERYLDGRKQLINQINCPASFTEAQVSGEHKR